MRDQAFDKACADTLWNLFEAMAGALAGFTLIVAGAGCLVAAISYLLEKA